MLASYCTDLICGPGCSRLISCLANRNKTKTFSIATHFVLGTLSNCLLYCGRHSDTQIHGNPVDQCQRFMVINLKHFPYIEFPFGRIPANEGDDESKG